MVSLDVYNSPSVIAEPSAAACILSLCGRFYHCLPCEVTAYIFKGDVFIGHHCYSNIVAFVTYGGARQNGKSRIMWPALVPVH